MVQIGEKYVRSELVIIPAQISVIDYYVASYKCAHCERELGDTYIEQAQAPVAVMKKSMASASTVAYIMQEKFQKGVPLYRQEEYWKGQGVDLRRNTMANWVIRSAQWFEPLWKLLRKELRSSDIVNADETDCHVLKEDGRESKQMSKMWVFCSPEKNIALYQYKPSRKGQVAMDMLKSFSGYLQSDGYSGYNCVDFAMNLSQQGMTFDTFQVTPETQRAIKICKAFSERWRDSKGKGILLTGDVGCGKTHLAAAICNQVIADYDCSALVKRQPYNDYLERCCPVRFQSSVELYSSLRQEMKRGGETLKKCKESPLLVLDDLGAERSSGWVTERLFELVDYRMGNKLPMVITTDLAAQQLSCAFGERIMDRVRSMCCLVELSGASRRVKC